MPLEEYSVLPKGYNVQFIDTEDKLSQMSVLIGQKYIGVDAEWRPERPSWGIMGNGPSILQIGGVSETFVVDILSLKHSRQADEMLTSIFSCPESTICGFAFNGDISIFNKWCRKMRFLDNITNFLEVQDMN